ncbi:homoserine kinase [Paraclostridium ghonii]|uniref:Homoserine kinase n=1 Tax=Paraclostridium ghonii TaxID=29358 RepID=A0ABU0MYL8_9FIRM|nr:homoserine kinase [Paeniclostridium ghonii]MDQ0556005.1 homoserine kinase [Paeniclostridium ghonii]
MIVKVKVPATSANLGCGFDTLGMALNLYTTFTFEEIKKGLEFEGFDEKYCNEDNLVYISFNKALKQLNKKVEGVRISVDCQVPISRGLGSSSICVVAGIFAAYALSNTQINRDDIFKLATTIEGHPDNVSPAIFGGLSASCVVNNEALTIKYDIDERFTFLALIPDFETSTNESRKALPDIVCRQDAIYTLSRLGMVLKALENYDLSLLSKVMDDKLHEPYRCKLIHEYDKVKEICKSVDSVCFMISGSGSTLLNVIEDRKNVQLIRDKLKDLEYKWRVLELKVDKEGTKIL